MVNILEYMSFDESRLLLNFVKAEQKERTEPMELARLEIIELAICDEIRARCEMPDEMEVV